MGRRFPIGENRTINPLLSLSLLIACVTSTIAIISLLCGSFSRKKDSNGKDCGDVFSRQNEATKTLGDSFRDQNKEADDLSSSIMSRNSCQKTLLPPPPPPQQTNKRNYRASSCNFHTNSIGSIGKLTSSMSVRGLRQMSRREDLDKKKYFKHEDSIWKKQIILGEKCRVPDEDDTIICDEKGTRISTYHPKKTISSLTFSRQSSATDFN